MKSILTTTLSVAILFLANCGNDKAAGGEPPSADNSSTEKTENLAAAISTLQDGLVGSWKLRLEVYDDNSNRIPDEEEMKKGYANNYMLQLNADGTCRIQQVFTGRYEKVKENGRDMLKIYRKKVEGEEDKDPPPDIYQLTSLKKDELVLQIIEAGFPSSFWFFNRVK